MAWNSTFEELMEAYLIPAVTFDITEWTTDDLVHLHNLIDIELQDRHAAAQKASR